MSSRHEGQPLPRDWIAKLFDRMTAFYGNKFSDLWTGCDMESVMDAWAIELGRLTDHELRAGVMALGGQEWPPTLPKFVSLCRPTIEPTKAYYEAVSGLQARAVGETGFWSHPAIFWAAAGMSYELRSYTFSQIRDRWEAALQAELAKGQWAPIGAPAKALPAPEGRHTDTRQYRDAEAFLQDLLRRASRQDFDHKRWAKRIIERAEQGDRTLTCYQVEAASDALKQSKNKS